MKWMKRYQGHVPRPRHLGRIERESVPGWVYVFKYSPNEDLYKIGSAENIHKRIAQLRTAAPFIDQCHSFHSFTYRKVEKELHQHFRGKRVAGEWFRLTDDDLDYIASLDANGHSPARQRAWTPQERRYWAERRLIEFNVKRIWSTLPVDRVPNSCEPDGHS